MASALRSIQGSWLAAHSAAKGWIVPRSSRMTAPARPRSHSRPRSSRQPASPVRCQTSPSTWNFVSSYRTVQVARRARWGPETTILASVLRRQRRRVEFRCIHRRERLAHRLRRKRSIAAPPSHRSPFPRTWHSGRRVARPKQVGDGPPPRRTVDHDHAPDGQRGLKFLQKGGRRGRRRCEFLSCAEPGVPLSPRGLPGRHFPRAAARALQQPRIQRREPTVRVTR